MVLIINLSIIPKVPSTMSIHGLILSLCWWRLDVLLSSCKLPLRTSKGSTQYRKATYYLYCSHDMLMKDQSKSVFDGDNIGKSDVKKEHLKQAKQSNKLLNTTRKMLPKKKQLQIKKKKLMDHKLTMKKTIYRRTVSGRALDVNQSCPMKIIVFLSSNNWWYLHTNSILEHRFHQKLEDTARTLGEQDLQQKDIRLVRSNQNAQWLTSIANVPFHCYKNLTMQYHYYEFTGKRTVWCKCATRYYIEDNGIDAWRPDWDTTPKDYFQHNWKGKDTSWYGGWYCQRNDWCRKNHQLPKQVSLFSSFHSLFPIWTILTRTVFRLDINYFYVVHESVKGLFSYSWGRPTKDQNAQTSKEFPCT